MKLVEQLKAKLNFGPSAENTSLDIKKVRAAFPALSDGYIFADNAGGSQCLKSVADHVSNYLIHTNAQLGADYSVSQMSTNRVNDGTLATMRLMNAELPEEIGFSSSSTQAVENLARAIEADVKEGEEIIITGEHESNASPWKKLAARHGSMGLKLWPHTILADSSNPYALTLTLESLLPLLTSKTRLIAFSACSNILGSVVDVATIVKAVRARCAELGARKVEFCLDCVAYAPHRKMDVRAWDVEYCYFSYYKVYGPHVGAIYAKKSSLLGSLSSLTHHFLDIPDKAYKLCPGGTGYELTYGVSAVLPYLIVLGQPSPADVDPSNIAARVPSLLDESFKRITQHEQGLLLPLMGYLTSDEARKKGVWVVGNDAVDESRAPTVSFLVRAEDGKRIPSKDIVGYFDRKGRMGIRYGHFYAYTLVEKMEPRIDTEDAVVRISLVHYNTVQEVEALVSVLKEALEALAVK